MEILREENVLLILEEKTEWELVIKNANGGIIAICKEKVVRGGENNLCQNKPKNKTKKR